MKTTFLVILNLCMLSMLNAQKPKVVASASMIADMAAVLGVDYIDLEMIVPIGGDPHVYEPTPADAQLVYQADLILVNGLTFEGWINELIKNSGTKAKVVAVTDGIDAISSMSYANAADPHAWMDATLAIQYAQNIAQALAEVDPSHAEIFESNFAFYQKELQDLDQYISSEIQKIPAQQRVLITSHDAFQYYGRRYGLQLESILGTSTDADAQTADIIRLNQVLKETGVPAVFIETTVNPKLLQQIASDNKVQIGGKLYSDSLGDKDSPAPTYIDMMRYNTQTIVAALSQAAIEKQEPKTNSKRSNLWIWLIPFVLIAFLIISRLWKR